ncbi:NusG domain II-containing protein [Saccharibacillus alkalitolerans]|uniref:NusG domain II-containing protein n=1 Tax=Saccharibacillus alkalitolerans TaxID=2705290 RepID=A0ABX0F2M3_9BACL|nr:NusG domain II-containing protein [Saccharibacillus alkalitolerans]NGZ74115.1 NusG domain II-containing protein [Saccharibacillus alkalitolerans]
MNHEQPGKQGRKRLIKRGDLLLIAAALILACTVLGWQKWREAQIAADADMLIAVITVNGQEYERVPLDGEERVIDIRTEFGHNTLKAYDRGIRMTYSDAPKRIALDMGFISRPHQQIVCVPTRVRVEVLPPDGGEDGGLDAVVGMLRR